MPIYEFKCLNCQEVSEFRLKIDEPAPATCPRCEKGSLQRLISRSAFHLKGGGWYSDLYSSTAKKSATDDAAAAPAKPAGDGGTSTPATPSAAPAAAPAPTPAPSKETKKPSSSSS